jgi:hypothetical protein
MRQADSLFIVDVSDPRHQNLELAKLAKHGRTYRLAVGGGQHGFKHEISAKLISLTRLEFQQAGE